MSKRNSLRTYAAGLAAVLALAGCQAAADPGPAPTGASVTAPGGSPTTSATGSTSTGAGTSSAASPTATGNALPAIAGLPEAAKHRTAEGANAFVTYYFEQMNAAYQRPDPSLLEPFGTKKCKTCAAYVETAKKLDQDGQRFKADRYTNFLSQGFGENLPSDPRYTVSAQMESTGAKVQDDATGKVIHTDPRRNVWLAVHLVWFGDGWRIDSIQNVDDGRGDEG